MRALIKQAVKTSRKSLFSFAMIAFGDGFKHRRTARRQIARPVIDSANADTMVIEN